MRSSRKSVNVIKIRHLVHLSQSNRTIRGSYEPEMYGSGKIYRKIGLYPNKFPLCIITQHGVSLWDVPQSHDLNSRYPAMLVHSKRMKDAWTHLSDTPCYVITHPYVYYRRLKRLHKNHNAKGSIFFLSHSTKEIDIKLNIQKLITQLQKLPKKFHPITICFHHVDINKELYKLFIENNFNCVTAGHTNNPNFVDNFYNILRNHQYSLSNVVGSYAFYSVDLNIPFSLYGQEPIYINKSDSSLPYGESNKTWSIPKTYTKAKKMFSKLSTKVTSRQKDFVDHELGKKHSISRIKFIYILYRSLILHKYKEAITRAKLVNRDVIADRLYLAKHKLLEINQIPTHLTLAEKLLIHKLLSKIQTKLVCVEIGSFLGASSCFIASAITKDSMLYCIDTWGNHAMKYESDDKELERDTRPDFDLNTKRYKNKITPVRGWSNKAIYTIRKETDRIDFLFIDGDHHYKSVKEDWELYSSLLRRGSYVAFHDTGWAIGVQKVTSQLVESKASLIASLPNMKIYRMK